MREDAILHVLRAIIDENHLLFEKENLIVYKEDGSIFQVMPEIVAVLPPISASWPTPSSRSPPLEPRRLLNPLQHFRRRRHFLDVWSCGGE
jgi:hypothetical protein